MASKSASGNGSIRKKTVLRNGKSYTYWEARYTEGVDPGTGKQIQRSVTGKTQKEVTQKLKAATAAIDAGTYTPPSKLTVGEWLSIWLEDYLGGVKPFTVVSYTGLVNNHIRPAMGALKLDTLSPHEIQHLYNSLITPKDGSKGLSAKTVKNIHGVLHKALHQAQLLGYIHFNPAEAVVLPRAQKKEIKPLDETGTKKFLDAIKGHRFEILFTTVLFTGLREGEALGLSWDRINFKNGTILVDRQLQREKHKNGKYIFAPLKNDKSRLLTPAPFVMDMLKDHKRKQMEQRIYAGPMWDDSLGDLVFTNELGCHLAIHTVFKDFKKVVEEIGCSEARFHDLRHSYAVASLRAGDDVKTVQSNLGHATASFTLDVYGHCTDQMKVASAARMQSYFKDVLGR